jgi:hypothetical protein
MDEFQYQFEINNIIYITIGSAFCLFYYYIYEYCDSFFPKEKVAGVSINFHAVWCRLSAEAFYIQNCGNRLDGLAQKDRELFVFIVYCRTKYEFIIIIY